MKYGMVTLAVDNLLDTQTSLVKHFPLPGRTLRIGYYWDLDEYREVNGVLFPHKIATSRKGGSSTYLFDEVVQNQPLPDSLFAMPEAAGE